MAGREYFEFKQFRIEQSGCAMKVGTDGVLLGAWANVKSGARVLDIGTGTGLIALMAAQRGAARVTAVEIDTVAAARAEKNVALSAWSDSIEVVCADIQDYCSNSMVGDAKFDLILSNPPYFRDSLLSPNRQRTLARHSGALSYETLSLLSAKMVAPNGELSVVLPYNNASQFIHIAALSGLYLKRQTLVTTKQSKPPMRQLLSFSPYAGSVERSTLVLFDESGNATQEYIELVKDFYLKF